MNPKDNLNIEPLANWWPVAEKPFLISGPCSAETEQQVLETAHQLKATGKVHLLRAGIWKPRTRPDSFEGVGEKGMKWMVRAKEETGLPITTEVANAHHVELCLKHNFDVLWIGARTTVNPFSVQEIADALQGVDIPVIVKNPLNADLQLWMGALERINRAGITKLVAMHRGFSYHGETIYRNKPMWEIPIALKTLYPQLEIFCDPSHICGRRDLLLHVAQRALDLGMNGLMLESHITPDSAWSDSAQQITPQHLAELIAQLNVRSVPGNENISTDELKHLRNRVDEIDEQLIRLLAKRMNVAHEIGEYKKEHNLLVLQVERWKEIVESCSSIAAELGLSKQFVAKYLEQIHKESIRRQSLVMSGKKISPGYRD
ncbi:MAG: chorismate mutase [Flavobacteriales bacterium]|nr:chorismate mutase [Flavobacteriales bacterium]